jgi:hypothetical protein
MMFQLAKWQGGNDDRSHVATSRIRVYPVIDFDVPCLHFSVRRSRLLLSQLFNQLRKNHG